MEKYDRKKNYRNLLLDTLGLNFRRSGEDEYAYGRFNETLSLFGIEFELKIEEEVSNSWIALELNEHVLMSLPNIESRWPYKHPERFNQADITDQTVVCKVVDEAMENAICLMLTTDLHHIKEEAYRNKSELTKGIRLFFEALNEASGMESVLLKDVDKFIKRNKDSLGIFEASFKARLYIDVNHYKSEMNKEVTLFFDDGDVRFQLFGNGYFELLIPVLDLKGDKAKEFGSLLGNQVRLVSEFQKDYLKVRNVLIQPK